MTSRIIKVGILTSYLREIIESDEVLQDVWVEGEVSNYTVPKSGHAYFSIKDDQSILACTMWRTARSRQSYRPVVGDQVVVHGAVTVYEAQGRYQLSADVIHPAGAGILQLRLEQLRQRLEAEGLFDPSRKRPLPLFPQRIGVVTSPTGAVWHDIQQVIGRRFPLVELVLAPSIVQGDLAPGSIVRSLAALQTENLDLIIVARGGGSAEDLASFNDERVARAIFSSRWPVVSAIGHETDTSIADLVADMRAPTPSAAAELTVPDIIDLLGLISSFRTRMGHAAVGGLSSAKSEVVHAQHRLALVSPVAKLGQMRGALAMAAIQLRSSTARQIERQKSDLDRTTSVLRALDPHELLQRGYAFVTDGSTGETLQGISSMTCEGRIRATFTDGYIAASITDIVASALMENKRR